MESWLEPHQLDVEILFSFFRLNVQPFKFRFLLYAKPRKQFLRMKLASGGGQGDLVAVLPVKRLRIDLSLP